MLDKLESIKKRLIEKQDEKKVVRELHAQGFRQLANELADLVSVDGKLTRAYAELAVYRRGGESMTNEEFGILEDILQKLSEARDIVCNVVDSLYELASRMSE